MTTPPFCRHLPAPACTAMVLLAGLLLSGCQSAAPMSGGDGNDNVSIDEEVSFSAQVQPIFTTNCAGCHSPGGLADLRGIALKLTADVAYDRLVNQPSVQAPSLTLVVPGDAEASLLVAKISSNTPPVGQRMPLFAPVLSATEIALIRAWIDQGALDN